VSGFEKIRLLPIKLYVFWKNPLNYVGLAATARKPALASDYVFSAGTGGQRTSG